MQAKRDSFRQMLRRTGQQGIFRGGKTDTSSIGEFQQRAAAVSVMVSAAMPFNIAPNELLAILSRTRAIQKPPGGPFSL
jgi:hypothetical protein